MIEPDADPVIAELNYLRAFARDDQAATGSRAEIVQRAPFGERQNGNGL
jgi:hypothetical protein